MSGKIGLSEKLKKAVADSRRKFMRVSEGGADFPAAFPRQTLAGIAFRAAGKSGNNFPAVSKIARQPQWRSLLEFSESGKRWPCQGQNLKPPPPLPLPQHLERTRAHLLLLFCRPLSITTEVVQDDTATGKSQERREKATHW